MKPLLVVQNNLVERLTGPLAEAARARGIRIHDLSSVDDMSRMRTFPDDESYDPVLVYGSIGFVHEWAKNNPDLERWVFWSEDAQSADSWRLNLGDLYLNADGWETSVGEAIRHEVSPRHYRPMTTTKKIAGCVLTPDELAKFATVKEVPMDFRLWSSEPKTIDAEYRVFMIDGEIVDYSLYRRQGVMCFDSGDRNYPHALDAVREITARWCPAKHFVCDVGLVDGQWGLVEFNPLHSSGWYNVDPGKVLDAYFIAEERSL